MQICQVHLCLILTFEPKHLFRTLTALVLFLAILEDNSTHQHKVELKADSTVEDTTLAAKESNRKE